MKHLVLLLAAAALSACSSPPVTTSAPPAAEVPAAAPAASPVETAGAGTAPVQPVASWLSGTVLVPDGYQSAAAPGRYVLGLKGAQRPLAGAEVTVTDEAGKPLGVTVSTDAEGHYALSSNAELGDRTIVLNVKAIDAAGRSVTLRTILRPRAAEGGRAADVTFTTTLVTAHVLADGAPADFTDAAFGELVAQLDETLNTGDVSGFDLSDANTLLRKLADVVDAHAELLTKFDTLGKGNAGRYNNRSHSGSGGGTSSGPAVVLTGQVL